MFNRDNAIGIVLVAICAVVAGVMLYYIGIGERPRLDFGTFGNLAIGALFFGLILFGVIKSGVFGRMRRGQRGPQWPDPGTGRKSWWDRLRGR
jgi:hypothetical protein